MSKQCSFVTEMWLDKRELFSNKNPHIVVLFRNKVASGAGDGMVMAHWT